MTLLRPLASSLLACGLLSTANADAQAARPGMAPAASNQAAPLTPGARGDLARAFVLKWGGYLQRVYDVPVEKWAQRMVPTFVAADPANFRAALERETFEAALAQLTGTGHRLADGAVINRFARESATRALSTKAAAAIGAKTLGSTTGDLVFTAVTPCRIVDTRVAGGTIPANGERSFDVSETASFTAQGGDAGDCGVGAAGPFAAAVVNFTVVTPAAAGYITAYPFGGARPLAATVNYVAGDIRGNLAIVKLNQDDDSRDLSVYTYADTHVVADLVGYYIHPQATALDCTEVSSLPEVVNAGAFGSVLSPACPSGYVMTGGGCSMSSFDGRLVTSRIVADAESYYCAFNNQGTAANQGVAYGRCCRTPGRP